MKIHYMEQNSPDWYKIREGKLTASKASTIYTAGKGLETLCNELMASKYSTVNKDVITNSAMEWGHEQEDIAAELYANSTGLKLEKVGFVEVNQYVGVSPDRVIFDDKKNVIKAVEIKCPTDAVYFKYLLDLSKYNIEKDISYINKEHYAQMQMQMKHLNLDSIIYLVYNPHFEKDFITAEVEINDAFQEKLTKGIEQGQELLQELEAEYLEIINYSVII